MNIQYIRFLTIPIFLFLPGFLLRIGTFMENKCNHNNISLLSIIFESLTISLTISGLFSLLLADMGKFNFINIFSTINIINVIFIILLYKNICKQLAYIKLVKTDILPFIITIFAFLVLFIKPFEFIYWGRDPAFYINNGIRIAKTGSLLFYDKRLNQTNPEYWHSMFYEGRTLYDHDQKNTITTYLASKLGGLYIVNNEGLIKPQLFHLYTSLFSLFYTICPSINFILYLTPITTITFIWSAYLFSKSLLKTKPLRVFFLITLLLNFTTVWFSKYPNAEMLMASLVFYSLYLYNKACKNKDKLPHIFSGVLLGLSIFIKLDTFFIIPTMFFIYSTLFIFNKLKPNQSYFFLSSFLVFYLGAIHNFIFSTPYLLDTISQMTPHTLLVQAINLFQKTYPVNLIIPFLLFILYKFLLTHIKKYFNNKDYTSRIILAFSVILLFSIQVFFEKSKSGQISSNDFNIIKLIWYTGFTPFFFSIISIFHFSNKKLVNSFYTFLLLFLHLITFYLFNANIYHDQPWWARRYTFFIIPSILLLSTAFYENIKFKHKTRIISLLFIFLVFTNAKSLLKLNKFVYYKGGVNFIEKLAHNLKQYKNYPIILSYNEIYRNRIGGSLLNIYDFDIIPLLNPNTSQDIYPIIFKNEINKHSKLYFIGEFLPFYDLSLNYKLVYQTTMPIIEWQRSFDSFSSSPNPPIYTPVRVWEISPNPSYSTNISTDFLDNTDLYPTENYNEKQTFRWTNGDFKFNFFVPPEISSSNIQIQLSIYPQFGQDPNSITIRLNKCHTSNMDTIINDEKVIKKATFNRSCLERASYNLIQITSTSFIPNDVDTRQLGLALSNIEIIAD